MTEKTIDHQARVYLFDLNNCAREFGFKADEGWELCLASQEEKKALEKQYSPIVSTKVLPEILADLFNSVKTGLSQVKSGIQNSIDVKGNGLRDLQYLVAYNPKRLIR
jgi:hypothetical protein